MASGKKSSLMGDPANGILHKNEKEFQIACSQTTCGVSVSMVTLLVWLYIGWSIDEATSKPLMRCRWMATSRRTSRSQAIHVPSFSWIQCRSPGTGLFRLWLGSGLLFRDEQPGAFAVPIRVFGHTATSKTTKIMFWAGLCLQPLTASFAKSRPPTAPLLLFSW